MDTIFKIILLNAKQVRNGKIIILMEEENYVSKFYFNIKQGIENILELFSLDKEHKNSAALPYDFFFSISSKTCFMSYKQEYLKEIGDDEDIDYFAENKKNFYDLSKNNLGYNKDNVLQAFDPKGFIYFDYDNEQVLNNKKIIFTKDELYDLFNMNIFDMFKELEEKQLN